MEQVRNEGGLWDESLKLYANFGAKPLKSRLTWRFPSGATLRFRHLQFEKDKLQYQGAQFAFIGFDELTHFSESQFFYLLSRNRSTCGVKPYVRATTNPDANSWVKRFLAPWVDPSLSAAAESGEVRHLVRDGGQLQWVENGDGAKSVTFIRASLSDNRLLMEADPDYLANLKALSLVDRRRLLDGDWEIVEGGNLFRREWFEILAVAPRCSRVCRYWDLAGTEEKPGRDPDWTVGVLLGRGDDGLFVVLDVQRVRRTPAGVEALIRQTAELDRAAHPAVSIRMEQEPGSGGLNVIDRYRRVVLPGFDFAGIRSTGSKAERARPFSAQAEAGNVKLLCGYWNNDFLNELSAFPMPEAHDDQVDAASGALACLCAGIKYHAASGGQSPDLSGYRF